MLQRASQAPLRLDPTDTTPLYAQLADQLRAAIAAHRWAADDHLPTVRALAAELGCTSGTVARAYALLQSEGVLVGRRGGGTRVAERPMETPRVREARLVNHLERDLLDALAQGFSPGEIESAFELALSRWRTAARPHLPTPQPPPTSLLFAGSHDLAVEALFRLAAGAAAPVTSTFVGSLGGLMALAAGAATLAGIHLLDPDGGYNTSFVHHLLPARRVVLLTVATREIGWIVPAGNPRALQRWNDMGRAGLNIINRQRGSGTRILLDRHLARLNIDASTVTGYAREVDTHLAVAETVARGAADAGLGIAAAARAFGLDFVPLTEEPYELVTLADLYATDAFQALLRVLRGGEFRALVSHLGGYRVDRTGDERWL